MEGMSLEQVVALLDKNLGELSAHDVSTCKRRVRHSTPDPVGGASNHGEGLELVGREMKTHVRSGVKNPHKPASSRMEMKTGPSHKGKVRNYNRKH